MNAAISACKNALLATTSLRAFKNPAEYPVGSANTVLGTEPNPPERIVDTIAVLVPTAVVTVGLPAYPLTYNCVSVLPEVGVTATFCIKSPAIALIRFNADVVLALSLANSGFALAGCITVLRSSSPTTAVNGEITIGNTSANVPVLTEIVVLG